MVTQFNEVPIVRALGWGGYGLLAESPSGETTGDYTTTIYGQGAESMDVVNWLHPTDPKPDETQMIQWENERLADAAAREAAREALRTELASFGYTLQDVNRILNIAGRVVTAHADGVEPAIGTLYEQFATALTGSPLEDRLKAYARTMTGLTNFGLGIPDSDKRSILFAVMQHLTTVLAITNAAALRGELTE